MHSRVYAEKSYSAQGRLVKAAREIAYIFGLPQELIDNLDHQGRAEAPIKALYQREAIADLLEAVIRIQANSQAADLGEAIEQAKRAQLTQAAKRANRVITITDSGQGTEHLGA